MSVPPLTPLQVGTQCALDCQQWAIETLSDDEYAAFVHASLTKYQHEAMRLSLGEALRALREEGES
jgi:hypothetical protein